MRIADRVFSPGMGVRGWISRSSRVVLVLASVALSSVAAAVTAAPASAGAGFALVSPFAAPAGLGGVSDSEQSQAITPATLAAPIVESERASVKATEVRLEGVVNPGGEPTECTFQYGSGSVSEKEIPCNPELLKGEGGQGVSSTRLNEKNETVRSITGLASNTAYEYRIVALNGTGTTDGTVQHFTTAIPPEAPTEEAPDPIGTTTATLHGVLNPNSEGNSGTYEFVYRQSPTECQGENEQRSPQTASTGAKAEAVEGEVTELLPGTAYTFCLLARNKAGEETLGAPATFTTVSVAPAISQVSSSPVGVYGASVSARVYTGGPSASYRVQYGTSSSYGSETAAVNTAGGISTVMVQLTGLQPSTEYHFRFIVTNEKHETTESADARFTTYSGAPAIVPDNRVYEMVTPVDNEEADVNIMETWGSGGYTQSGYASDRAAADGDMVIYESGVTSGGGVQSFGNMELATRSPAGGWTQQSIHPSGITKIHYKGISSELTNGVMESLYTPLVPGAPEHGFYLYRPGVSGPQLLPGKYVGESTDGSHQLVEEGGRLYEVAAGVKSPVGVLPNGQLAGASSLASPVAVSTDGSEIVWSSEEAGQQRLYARDMASGETVQLDAAQGGPGSGGGHFQAINGSGSEVFFTDEEQLTGESSAAPGEPDLYEYDLHGGRLADLTVDRSPGGHADVQGLLGSSESGEYVYFAAAGVLAAPATEQQCTNSEPAPTGCNLYVSHDGETKFITTLSAGYEDSTDWSSSLVGRTAEVSASGSLVFSSNRSLTGYDNTGQECLAEPGFVYGPGPCAEIYLYDPIGGDTVCVSCASSGEPQVGIQRDETINVLGNFLPSAEQPGYQMRWISDDGDRVFFVSGQRLVEQDKNGVEDVYEWERDGTGSCETEPGCIYLLSGGTTGVEGSYLLDTSASGDDVFIISRSPLVPEGQGKEYALYDARVGGVRAVSPPACTGTGCQGVPAPPPVFATPSSVTFNGIGNFPPSQPASPKQARASGKKIVKCAKGRKAHHGQCVKARVKHRGRRKQAAGKSSRHSKRGRKS